MQKKRKGVMKKIYIGREGFVEMRTWIQELAFTEYETNALQSSLVSRAFEFPTTSNDERGRVSPTFIRLTSAKKPMDILSLPKNKS